MEKQMDETEEMHEEAALGTDNDLTTVESVEQAKVDAQLSRILLEHPNVCGLLGDLLGGMDENEAISRNLKSWRKKQKLKVLPVTDVDDTENTQLLRIVNDVANGKVDVAVVRLLQRGMNYDTAVATAEAEGFVKGKNEKIDLVKTANRGVPVTDEKQGSGRFPRYAKKSVWDNEK